MLPRRFSDLSAFGRGIIVTVAVITMAITVVAFAASYNALYRLFGQLDLYGEWITRAIPLLLDAAFIGGELAAILAGILRAVTGSREVHRGWPVSTLLVCGTLTIVLNVVHAYLLHDDPLRFWRCLAAALPPVLMMLAFQVDIAIVRWVMVALGRPLTNVDAQGTFLGGPVNPQMQNPSVERFALGPNGHEWGSGGEAPGAASTKRERVQAYLARLGPNAAILTAREVKEDLAEEGVSVSEQYVGQVMSRTLGRNGNGKP